MVLPSEELEKDKGQGEEKTGWKGARTRCAIFLIRRGPSHHFLGEWFHDKSIPVGRRRRMMRLVLGNVPCGTWIHDKIGTQRSDRCTMCRKALRTERGLNFRDEETKELVEAQRGGGRGREGVRAARMDVRDGGKAGQCGEARAGGGL